MIPLTTYIHNLEQAIQSNPKFFLNADKDQWFATFRDIGFGLKDYPEDQVKHVIGSLYGKLFIKIFIQSNTPVPDISAKAMVNQLYIGMGKMDLP